MIPLVKPILGDKEKKLVAEVLDSGMIASGKYVDDFEALCAKKWNSKFAVAVSNGTTALHAALLASGIKPGDKVITTPFSFIATANSILFCGAKPVFCDIDPLSYNISVDNLETILAKEKNIKAVLIVHLYGNPCDMDRIMELKTKYGFALIEDCAQAHLAKHGGKCAGTFGNAGTLSFYATKNMTTGEGGMVLTDDEKTNVLLRQIINHGRKEHQTHVLLGYNYRLTNLQAAIGLAQLENIENWNLKRQENARFLNENLKDIDFISVPKTAAKAEHVFHQYTVRVKTDLRDQLLKYLSENKIGAGVYYPYVMYEQPFYLEMGYKSGLCPEAEKATKEVLSLPVHPLLAKNDLSQIVKIIKEFRPK